LLTIASFVIATRIIDGHYERKTRPLRSRHAKPSPNK